MERHENATRLAFIFPLIAEIIGVIVVPMFIPKRSGNATEKVILIPDTASAISTPTDADED